MQGWVGDVHPWSLNAFLFVFTLDIFHDSFQFFTFLPRIGKNKSAGALSLSPHYFLSKNLSLFFGQNKYLNYENKYPIKTLMNKEKVVLLEEISTAQKNRVNNRNKMHSWSSNSSPQELHKKLKCNKNGWAASASKQNWTSK